MPRSEFGEASTDTPQQRVPYYIKGLALGIPVYFVAIHMWTWILSVPIVLPKGGYDFRQIYAASYMVRTGQAKQLYDYDAQKDAQDKTVSPEPVPLPYVSPAYEALVLAPLSCFRFRTAYFVFLAINVAALSLCFVLMRPWMTYLTAIYGWLPIALFLGFLPIAATLIEEQDSILLTTCVIGSWILLVRRRAFLAGIVLGAAFFKFPIILPIALLFLFWRQWRFLFGLTTAGVALATLSIWLTGIAQSRVYVETLLSIAGFRLPTNGLAVYPVNWSMMANVHGFLFSVSNQWLPKHVLQAMTILVSTIVIASTVVRGWRVKQGSSLLLLATPCSVLISHHAYSHDLSVLLLPMIVFLDNFLPAEAYRKARERWIARIAALIFIAPVMESYSRTHFYIVAIPVGLLVWAAGIAVSMESFALLYHAN